MPSSPELRSLSDPAVEPRGEGPGPRARGLRGVDANERLTSANAVLLLVLLAAEGATVLSVRALLNVHVFVGAVLIPLIAVKIASTTYRFAHYYRGDPVYVRKGPPPWLLRLLGPVVVALTVILFGSGVALLFPLGGLQRLVLVAHKGGFVLWFGAMTVHVLGHLAGTARYGLPDWTRRVPGAPARRALLILALAAGVVLGLYLLTRVGPYLVGPGAKRFLTG